MRGNAAQIEKHFAKFRRYHQPVQARLHSRASRSLFAARRRARAANLSDDAAAAAAEAAANMTDEVCWRG